jgi:hypothetical protein
VVAAAVVLILGIVSLVNEWGGLMIVPILAAAVVLGGILIPQLSPSTRLPASKALVMLVAGAAAGLFWLIAALTWFEWITGHLGSFDTLQFLVGLAASLVLAWAGWREYQAAAGTGQPAPPAPPAT